jgi:PAS domain S-box-containing protein
VKTLHHSQTSRHNESQQARPTIGLLIEGFANPFMFTLWSGIVETARERAVNLVCFLGGDLLPVLKPGVRFGSVTNMIYTMATAKTLDGLIMVGSLASLIGFEGFKTFCESYHPLPIVTTGIALDGMSSVQVDNMQGERELIRHLIEEHRYRRIAFIRGPEGYKEADQRYQAYTDVLTEYGLPVDPRLVTPGGFGWANGREAIRILFDQRRMDVEVVAAVNDLAALGALEELHRRGIRVGNDIAVVGFDNIQESGTVTPPLTTVQQPIYELGHRAIGLILASIAGDAHPEQVILPAELIVRQSCGCLAAEIKQAVVESVEVIGTSFERAIAAKRAEIIAEIIRSLDETEKTIAQSEQVFDAFVTELSGTVSGTFLATLDDALRQVVATDGNVAIWQRVISVLRQQLWPYLKQKAMLERADNLWHQARVMICQTAQRTTAYQVVHAEQAAQILRAIREKLLSAFQIGELLNVLEEGLLRLGIPSCYLALYDHPASPLEGSRLIMAYRDTRRLDLEQAGRRFPSLDLFPEGMLSQDHAYCLMVEPLSFQEEQIGFVIFEVGPQDRTIYPALQGDISIALQGALLVQRVREHAAELARQQYILDTFMEMVPDRIYFKDRESRITRANKAHALLLGLRDPAEEIGKTDFDFFPEDQARSKFEQEQTIVCTGQPILALEEPDGKGQWALTTKMPLRDEYGQIIGTFGVSRDITVFKQTQEALEKAYSEVEQRVAERTAELQQEIAERKRAEEMVRKLNEELEQRVHERTKALQESNQALQESLHTLELAQQQLIQSEKMASLGGLVAGITHEINTPLGVGVTAASHLEMQSKTIEQLFLNNEMKRSDLEHYLHTASESSHIILRNLERASEHIQSFKRIAVNQTHEERLRFKFKPYLDDILTSLRPQLKRVKHRVTVTCPPELEIISYPGVFSQIISNLILNSLIHGFEGIEQGEILLDVTEQDAYLIIKYRDTGKGMDKNTVKRVFDPFFTTRRGQGGSGLGMYIVYNLVTQKLHGHIVCKSQPGQGVKFTIWIPLETEQNVKRIEH